MQPPPSQVPLWHPKEPQVADANPVTSQTAPKQEQPKAPKVPKESGSPLDKFKTVLPNGLTVHNFVA